MDMKYRIRYWRINSSGDKIPCTKDIYGVSPLSALNNFHREMQLGRELADDRKTVLRDRLKPDEYSIEQIAILYNSDPSGRLRGETIESSFDLRKNTKNPDLWPKEETKQNAHFGFMDEVLSGRLAE